MAKVGGTLRTDLTSFANQAFILNPNCYKLKSGGVFFGFKSRKKLKPLNPKVELAE